MKITVILALVFTSTLCVTYNYNYQLYDLFQHQLRQGPAHPASPFGASTSPMNAAAIQLALKSLLSPSVSPNTSVSSTNFLKSWNSEFGYNFASLGAVQENIGCRARCQRLSEVPVCGDTNFVRYYNACDAECDQETYNTSNLRYNNNCCCTDASLSLDKGDLVCISDSLSELGDSHLKMVLNQCLAKCLTQNGDKLEQDNDFSVPC